MEQEIVLRKILPGDLVSARNIAHKAVQFATKAARANLPVAADDSHSNLGWNSSNRAFFSQPLLVGGDELSVGVSLSPLKLLIRKKVLVIAELDLADMSEVKAMAWLDETLEKHDLKAASAIKLPYKLPAAVEKIDTFNLDSESLALSVLADWFDIAHHVLSGFAKANEGLSPGPSPVRCWPHHFDIATYVGLEDGDFETAKGIGVGMSPGDDGYDQPYFYINPWPHLDADDLPTAPEPGHWHTEGFVGAIATGDEVLSLTDISQQLPSFVDASFTIGLEKLGV
ncbi:MAG: hypothetical protein V7723_10440 [Sneathiella sp.]|uniref:hypothetical protein n=1 Tax=Sneathiella sp. TaxID=1964365 RepID=UPI0030034EB3